MRVFNFLMMKIDVCIISGNFIVNPNLVLNQDFHAIFVEKELNPYLHYISFSYTSIPPVSKQF